MGVTLLLDLSLSIPQPTPEDIVVKTLDDFTLEELSELTVTAFTSTPEDRAVHGFYSTVTDYDQSLQLQQAIKNGKFGHSPADFWRIAVVDGEPAGLLIGWIPEFKYRPPFGIIGELGVSPNFRRIGVASLLVNQINQLFLKKGCQYSWVGTPETNRGGLELYQSLGFVPIIGLIEYEVTL
jgi:ribosomal protein S18 acetylase RimI-like enzyme